MDVVFPAVEGSSETSAEILYVVRQFFGMFCVEFYAKKWSKNPTFKQQYLFDVMIIFQFKIYYLVGLIAKDMIACLRIVISSKLTKLFKCGQIWAKFVNIFFKPSFHEKNSLYLIKKVDILVALCFLFPNMYVTFTSLFHC